MVDAPGDLHLLNRVEVQDDTRLYHRKHNIKNNISNWGLIYRIQAYTFEAHIKNNMLNGG